MQSEPLRLRDIATPAVERPRQLEPQQFQPKGKFHVQHFDRDGNLKGEYDFPNGITDVGLNHILETEFNGGTPVTAWYIGLIDNASFSALAAGDTMGSHAGWIETSAYDEATRPEWTAGTASARSITNASTVDFTINATKTIKGIFITSNNTKGGTTGTLWSTAAFGSTVSVADDDVLKVTYTLSG
jgi:hypothetical protein